MKKYFLAFLFLINGIIFSQTVALMGGGSGDGYVYGDPDIYISYGDVQTPTNDQTTFIIKGVAGYRTVFFWGDYSSTVVVLSTTATTVTHNYATTGTYMAYIWGNATKITFLQCNEDHIQMNLAQIGEMTGLLALELTGEKYSSEGSSPSVDLFGYNNYSGSLADLTTCTGLTYLALADTHITGDITNIHHLPLVHLFLNCKKITGDVNELDPLTSLTYLGLYTAGFSGDIDDLQEPTPQEFVNLDSLTFWNTDFIGIFADIEAAWPEISYLHLYGAGIIGDFGDITDSSRLINDLYLSGNSFTVSLTDIGTLPSATLHYLLIYVSENYLTGSLSSISSKTALDYLNLYATNNVSDWTGTTTNLSGLVNLTKLFLWDCGTGFTGAINTLSALTKITEIWIDTSPDLTYTTVTLPTSWNGMDFTSTGLSSSEVDQIIIDVNTMGTSNGYLRLLGNANRTSASTTAYNALISRGWIIYVMGP